MMKVDYIIVGQGLCGTLLSRKLVQAGKSVFVIDNRNPTAAGRVAGGIINPVTGKRLVQTWLIDTLLPFAQNEYATIGQELQTSLMQECSILDFHPTMETRTTFNEKATADGQYLSVSDKEEQWQAYFRFNYGIGSINDCLLVDLRKLIKSWGQYLTANNNLTNEHFSLSDCTVTNEAVVWNNITADKILFCDGANAATNPYFELLPWSKDKGEALIVAIPDLPRNNIYKQNISIVPWKDDLFWVGASHDWKYTTTDPTSEFRNRIEQQLDFWLKLPYTIVEHITALRPANFDRKPFIGFHPIHQSVGIFNGMGGKGCSLAPYFARQFSENLVNGKPLMPDVDIKRYSKILSR